MLIISSDVAHRAQSCRKRLPWPHDLTSKPAGFKSLGQCMSRFAAAMVPPIEANKLQGLKLTGDVPYKIGAFVTTFALAQGTHQMACESFEGDG